MRHHVAVGISDKDRKILWGRSGNRCAMCRRVLVAARTATDDEAVVGDEAHIAARSPGGPRFGECPVHATDRYENLILLCRVDHKVVDDQPRYYTAEHLRRLKADHEEWVNRLLSDPALEHRPASTPPRQLPPVPRLVGRDADLSALNALVAEATDDAGPAVLTIDGPPGVGTSALAVTFAHSLADRFVDGQLYVNLRGQPAHEALAGVLRSFGVSNADIPDGEPQRVAAYHSIVAGLRLLVVVDNVWEFEQVAPFLPASNRSLVLVTSRIVLAPPVGARHRSIEPLPYEHAVALLRLAVREPTHGWYRDADERLARLSGGFPLLLTAIAAALNSHRFSDAELAKGLTCGRLTLSVLDTARIPVTASIAESYHRLPPTAARAFRRLGAFPVRSVTDGVLTALAGIEPAADDDVRRRLAFERLLCTPLIPDYTLPTPFRMYAYHLLVEELGPDGPDRVFSGALSWYATRAESSISLWLGTYRPDEDPEMVDFYRRGGQVFFGLEIENLVEALSEAFLAGKLESLFELASPVIEYLAQVDEKGLWDKVAALVRDAAVELPETPEVSYLLLQALHDRFRRLERDVEARECVWAGRRIALDRADETKYLEFSRLLLDLEEKELTEATAAGDQDWIAESRLGLGEVHAELGQHDKAREYLLTALIHFRQTGNTEDEAEALRELGELATATRRPSEALPLLRESIQLYRRTEDDQGLALALDNMATAFEQLNRPADAARANELATALFTKLARRGPD